MRLWFAPACLHIPARDNSIVSRSGRHRYRIRKLVWSCRSHSRNSLICFYHAVLQCSFLNVVVPPRPSQREGCWHGTRGSGAAVLSRNRSGYPPCADGRIRLPRGSHKSMEGLERAQGGNVCICRSFPPGWPLLPRQAAPCTDAAPGHVVNSSEGVLTTREPVQGA